MRDAPVECLWLRIRVSDGGRFAKVDPETMNAERLGSRCLRYAGDGFFVLRKKRAWRVVYVGSDPPPCSLRFPRGLVRCLR